MDRRTYELMIDHVQAIYRAVTGGELPSPSGLAVGAPADLEPGVAAAFAQLDTAARLLPGLALRLPPMAFAPAVDVCELDNEVLVDVEVPGVRADAVAVQIVGRTLVLWGVRVRAPLSNGRVYRRAEIPRGPFRRVVVLPVAVTDDPPRLSGEDGVVRIALKKVPMATLAVA